MIVVSVDRRTSHVRRSTRTTITEQPGRPDRGRRAERQGRFVVDGLRT
jgi:hypothetical protein